MNSLPAPSKEGISLRKTEGGIAAAIKFSGKPTDDVVREKEKQLRSSLIRDGLKPRSGCMLARYNDPGRTWKFIMVCSVFWIIVCFVSSLIKFLCFIYFFVFPDPIISPLDTNYDPHELFRMLLENLYMMFPSEFKMHKHEHALKSRWIRDTLTMVSLKGSQIG